MTRLLREPKEAVWSEKALVRAAQLQDHDAFEQLVRLYDRSVLRIAMNLLGSEEDARDAYQETFLRAYRGLQGFSFQSSFHTWLYRIVTNVCLDLLRRRKTRRERTIGAAADGAGPNRMDQAPDPRADSNPGRILTGRRMASRIANALDQLSPRERVVFELKHYEGLKLRTIAEMLSISEEAAKNTLFRATRKLRMALRGVES